MDQLELVEQVGLEPERRLVCPDKRSVAHRERFERVLVRRPAAIGREAGADLAELAVVDCRHRPLVEHVEPGQVLALDPGGAHRRDDDVAVRDVEHG